MFLHCMLQCYLQGGFNMKLIDKRLELRFSQEALALKAGVTRPTIARAENGGRVTKKVFDAICGALGVSSDEITDVRIYHPLDRRYNRKNTLGAA